MPTTTIEKFHPVSINNGSVQFKNGNTHDAGTSFGCVGSLEGETEITTKQLKCGSIILKEISKPNKTTLTVTLADVPVTVARKIFGLSNKDLKPGVYAYGTNSKGAEFIFTGDVIDDFEEVTKLIAFPKCTTATGFKISIDNGADEVANIEFELTALPDEHGEIVYEALVAELEDPAIATAWHTAFNRELVASTNPETV